jgi:NAD(P)-dependent dehydrogenase (short-subunit alcohol dehydrogenase family)
MDISLKGRAAIITGGSMGLGLACAERFAESGADVAIVARGKEALDAALKSIKAKSNGKVAAISADVSTAAGCQGAFDEAMKALGRIDILMSNAGGFRAAPIEQLTDDMFQADIDQKVFAQLRLSRLVWPQMKERRWGRIVNVLSIMAKAPASGTAPTSVSRAAGMALTKVLAGEGAPHNILVNALLVGSVRSTQHDRGAERAGIPVDELLAQRGKSMPMGRIGRADEFANLACFLVSENGSYVTGTAINVDGGVSPVV